MEKIKSYGLKILVFFINLGLVVGGVTYIKKQQDKKKSVEIEEANAEAELSAQQVSDKAQQLDQIIKNNADQKNDSVANNPAEVTVQQPKTVTQVVPGGTTTVKTTKPAPAKTTKKS